MKKLELKSSLIPVALSDQKGPKVHYRELIEGVLNNPPRDSQGQSSGFALSEMDARLRVLSALRKCENCLLELEDADAKKLIQCVNEMRWSFVHEGFSEFSKDVKAQLNKDEESPSKPDTD